MPGFSYANGNVGGQDVDQRNPYLLANSLTGGQTSTAPGSLYTGDLVALTTNATYATAGGINTPVVRQLVYADIITNNLGNGLLGVATDNVITSSTGLITGTPLWGLTTNPVIFAMPAPAARFQVDTYTSRNWYSVSVAGVANQFKCRIAPQYTGAVMGPNLIDTLAAVHLIVGVSPPATPTTSSQTTGGSLTLLSTVYYCITLLNVNSGSTNNSITQTLETTPSGVQTVTLTGSNNAFVITAPTTVTAQATKYQVYTSSNINGPFQLVASSLTATGSTYTVNALGTGVAPPTFNQTGLPGVPRYYAAPSGTTSAMKIISVNNTDPLYGTTLTATGATPGVEVVVQFLNTLAQADSANSLTSYTAN